MLKAKYDIKDKNYVVPSDVNLALRHTILTIRDLCDVLERETNALKKSNTGDFLALQDEKVMAANRYELLVNNMMGRGDTIKKADPKLKAILEDLQDEFSQICLENLRWMERMKKATEKLGETIMNSARKSVEKQTQFAYGASGKMQKGNKALIGVDERA